MQTRHQVSPAWRGAPWGRRLAADWHDVPIATPPRRHVLRPVLCAATLGLALGLVIAHGIARQDRAGLDTLMDAVDPE